jgi:hypothetical protein
MHLKDVILKIVHETRMSLTIDSLPDILMEIIHVFEMEVYMKLFTVKDIEKPYQKIRSCLIFTQFSRPDFGNNGRHIYVDILI